MAWIEKTRGGYRVVWRVGGRAAARQWRGAPDKRTATELQRRIERDLALHGRVTIDDVPETPPALHARLDAWLDALALSVGPRTVTSYSDAATLLLRWLVEATRRPVEDLPVTALTRDALVTWQAWLLDGGRTLTTVAKRAQAVRLAWEWLWEGADRRWLEAPPRKITTRKSSPPRPIAPTWAEADAVVAACYEHDARAPWLYPFALVARFTGLRRSEILLLEWADLAGGDLTIRGDTTKGGYSGRRVPVAPLLLDELGRLPRDPRWVVPAPAGERVAAAGAGRGHVDRNMRRAWVRAGVAPAKFAALPRLPQDDPDRARAARRAPRGDRVPRRPPARGDGAAALHRGRARDVARAPRGRAPDPRAASAPRAGRGAAAAEGHVRGVPLPRPSGHLRHSRLLRYNAADC